VEHHGAGLLRVTKDTGLVEELRSGKEIGGILPRQACMLRYAEKLTTAPASISEDDIHTLREHGFSDRAILEINVAAAYMNFVNRVALGLGVQLEESMERFKR
jgi:uncharacterized peroxidase-related enzyme